MTMKTQTDFTYSLSADETREAVWRYLKDPKEVTAPMASTDLKIKWNAKGEAQVSFTSGGDEGVATFTKTA